MIYEIHTTDYSEPPCEEAFKKHMPQWDIRTIDERGFNIKLAGKNGRWRDNGSEHCVLDNGNIARRMEDEELWCVEIKSLQELNDLSMKYGDLIINYKGDKFHNPSIEIYDGWRE